jgi:micrococcal nuclease
MANKFDLHKYLYHYKASVIDVYDGDSITVNIDLGFGIIFEKQKMRLLDLDAPEIRGEERPAGLISRDALREKILNKQVFIHTKKDKKGKYGRYLADIYLENNELIVENVNFEDVYENINDWLIDNNYAEYKKY